jgi:hypothetical protein
MPPRSYKIRLIREWLKSRNKADLLFAKQFKLVNDNAVLGGIQNFNNNNKISCNGDYGLLGYAMSSYLALRQCKGQLRGTKSFETAEKFKPFFLFL